MESLIRHNCAHRMRVLINPYLNAAPLWWTLRVAAPDGWEIDAAVPSAAVRALEAGSCELALVSAVSLLQLEGVRALHGWGVASAGPVDTVVLVHKTPLDRLCTVGVDAASRSAQALLKTLCARRWRIAPQFVPVEDPAVALLDLDAVLAIGDKAFGLGAGLPRLDLASEWRAWTGMPFLFAAWAARPAAATPTTAVRLKSAGEAGLLAVPEICAAFGKQLRLKPARLEGYLNSRVHHRLGEAEWAALDRFAVEASAAGVLEAPRSVEFFG